MKLPTKLFVLFFLIIALLALTRLLLIGRDEKKISIDHVAQTEAKGDCSLDKINLVKLKLDSFTQQTTPDYADLEDITFYYSSDKGLSAVDIERVGDISSIKATAYICENEIAWMEIVKTKNQIQIEGTQPTKDSTTRHNWYDYRNNESIRVSNKLQNLTAPDYFYERAQQIYNQGIPERSN